MTGDAPPWQLVLDEFYVRDISGKEVAIYSGSSLTQWNIYGLDNVGKMNADTTKYYYLKDHLGTIRVVLNSTNQVVSANDYDCWGYAMQNRSYQSTNTMYKFTGKERDNESNYDYFGARYYDSKIGRWGGVEPNLDKFVGVTPYCYSINNPIVFFDPNGKDPRRDQLGSLSQVKTILEQNAGKTLSELSDVFANSDVRYIATEKSGFIDLRHFFAAAYYSTKVGKNLTLWMGEQNELFQDFTKNSSKYDPEDIHSNLKGAEFGEQYGADNIVTNFSTFVEGLGAVEPSDSRISESKLYIPDNADDELNNPLPERQPERDFWGKSKFNYSPFFGVKARSNPEELSGFGGN